MPLPDNLPASFRGVAIKHGKRSPSRAAAPSALHRPCRPLLEPPLISFSLAPDLRRWLSAPVYFLNVLAIRDGRKIADVKIPFRVRVANRKNKRKHESQAIRSCACVTHDFESRAQSSPFLLLLFCTQI